MALFRLLQSQHYQADPNWKPSAEDKENAKIRGIKLRAPSKKFEAGEVVESDIDLTARFGAEKFAPIVAKKGKKGTKDDEGEDDKETLTGEAPTFAAPGGQVAQGKQLTTGSADGGAFTGVDTEERREQGHALAEERKKDQPLPVAEKQEKQEKTKFTRHELSQMTVGELKQLAKDEDIDLAGAHAKDEIIGAVLKSQK